MNILAIDTATETLALCLKRSDGKISTYASNIGWQHVAKLLPAFDWLLQANQMTVAELGLIVCSLGPGSFTGLRIGLATAKGLAAGAGCPLVGVSTLEALAYPLSVSPAVVVPLIDAKKQQVYAALFQNGQRLGADMDAAPHTLAARLAGYPALLFTGPYARAFVDCYAAVPGQSVLLDPLYADCKPAALAALGLQRYATAGAAPDTLSPVYIRASEAEEKRRM